jgi:hypothetical protein
MDPIAGGGPLVCEAGDEAWLEGTEEAGVEGGVEGVGGDAGDVV